MLGKDKRTPQIAQLLTALRLPRSVVRAAVGLLQALGQKGTANGLRAFGYKDTAHYWQLVETQVDYQSRFQDALDHDKGGPFDVILAPVSPLPAFHHGNSRELLSAGAYACLYNVLGYPAGVVPFTRVRKDEEVGRKSSSNMVEKVALKTEQGSAGLPIGVQVIARPWREHVALAAMCALERLAQARADFPQTPLTTNFTVPPARHS
jgi:fatty acid amide hydrolase